MAQGTKRKADCITSIGTESFYNNSRFSDFTVHTREKKFHVHKIILASKSTYFDTLFNCKWKETVENAISLNDSDNNPKAIEAMLYYMYHDNYSTIVSDVLPKDGAATAIFHADVFRAGDKFGISSLKEQANLEFSKTIKSIYPGDDFFTVIREVYTNMQQPVRTLKSTIANVCYNDIDKLMEKGGLNQVLEQIPGFAVDVNRWLAKKWKKVKSVKCSECGYSFSTIVAPGHKYCVKCRGTMKYV